MDKITKYIVSFLLVIFTIPQVNNAIHYFVVDHHYSGNFTNKEQFQNVNHDHNCAQYIFIQSALLLPTLFNFTPSIFGFYNKNVFFIKQKIHVFKVTNFYTRGPPISSFIIN